MIVFRPEFGVGVDASVMLKVSRLSKIRECCQFLFVSKFAVGQDSKRRLDTVMPKFSAASVKLAVAVESSSSSVSIE